MPVTIIVDAFYGDAGKGKISRFLAERFDYDIVARAGTGTNAGHGIYFRDGNRIILRQLPSGWQKKHTKVMVGSGVAVDPRIFFKEIDEYSLGSRAKIDFRCPIITQEYIDASRKDEYLMKVIGCVGSGTGYTRSQFLLRKAMQAKEIPELREFITDVAKEVNSSCKFGKNVLIEGSQATLLSLALSPDYPYTTSDNCTSIAFADDVGLDWRYMNDVILLVKAVPSRVGEGPLPYELTKEEILERGIEEYGTVTNRFRRKASKIDFKLLEYSTMLNGPTQIALTYCDHYDCNVANTTRRDQISRKVWGLVEEVERVTETPVTILETGKYFENIIYLEDRVK